MTVFKYTGRTSAGVTKKGTIEAVNQNAAIAKLRERGINPREISASSSIMHMEINIGSKVKNQDFVIYCRQFATLIRAGVSIVEATNILARQSTSKPLKRALEQVEDDVRSGIAFSQAVSKHPKVFPELFINMMRSGEATGNIDSTLERLANMFEKQYNLKKKVQSTLAYPAVLTVLIIVVVAFLLIVIVPSFVTSFEDMGAELPTITVITVAFSAWLQKFWWLVLLVIFVGIAVCAYLFKNNKQFHFTVHYMLLKMPLFGPLLQKTAIARLMRTLASLFSAAVPILQALTISEKVSGNPVVGKIMLDARASLERGSTLSEPLEQSWVFPPMVTSMVQIGETTGSLDMMLEKIADFYEEEVDRSVDTLKSLIEPLMIVFLAAAVGIIVAAIFMPMFALYEQM
ncbi:type II secretion system F family protein [Metasolibacillus meyeri]|uniref:Type II secretion system F family protein n=1 Tax=Metasolibacillus meyeri TaxID=1071052 RepID=A0AAW9NX15_9BACL|nr:type II secretion system F family protein [Metasolibacillus meyeri]MEC1179245.1 type II secretion system F family protein [Metasolibacillus meyeri]